MTEQATTNQTDLSDQPPPNKKSIDFSQISFEGAVFPGNYVLRMIDSTVVEYEGNKGNTKTRLKVVLNVLAREQGLPAVANPITVYVPYDPPTCKMWVEVVLYAVADSFVAKLEYGSEGELRFVYDSLRCYNEEAA